LPSFPGVCHGRKISGFETFWNCFSFASCAVLGMATARA
jgi:hypothetical protein